MLTAQRHKELHNQLTNIAKKVYDSVPKNTAWSIKQITTDASGIRLTNKTNGITWP